MSVSALPAYLGAMGSGPPSRHYLIAREQWAIVVLLYTAPLLGSDGQWDSLNTVPHC